MRTRGSNCRSSFGMKCVQCSNELIAPERSEYWSDKRACHGDEQVIRETQYFGDQFEPGPSRSQWVERMRDGELTNS